MSTIKQSSLFSWDVVNNSPEILRLKHVMDVLPDHELIKALIADRKARRDDYPLEVLWNSLLAGVVFWHESVASLIRDSNATRNFVKFAASIPSCAIRLFLPNMSIPVSSKNSHAISPSLIPCSTISLKK